MRIPSISGAHGYRNMVAPHDSKIEPTEVVPVWRYTAGLYPGNPVGLFVVAAVLLIGLIALPEARWFLSGAILLGGIWGCVLWLRHRS